MRKRIEQRRLTKAYKGVSWYHSDEDDHAELAVLANYANTDYEHVCIAVYKHYMDDNGEVYWKCKTYNFAGKEQLLNKLNEYHCKKGRKDYLTFLRNK